MISGSNKITLFVLPYAGGGKSSYQALKNCMPETINFYPVEIPGRGTRMKEKPKVDIHELIEDIYNQIKDRLESPYAIYGHSMGTVLAYLLTKKIINEGQPLPLHLFVSGRGAPACGSEKTRYLLPKEELKQELILLGGIPLEFSESKSVMDYIEPILRADFQALELYKYIPSKPLDIPITVLMGKEDTPTIEQIMAWQNETIFPISLHKFSGGHFFIFDHIESVTALITNTLLSPKQKLDVMQTQSNLGT